MSFHFAWNLVHLFNLQERTYLLRKDGFSFQTWLLLLFPVSLFVLLDNTPIAILDFHSLASVRNLFSLILFMIWQFLFSAYWGTSLISSSRHLLYFLWCQFCPKLPPIWKLVINALFLLCNISSVHSVHFSKLNVPELYPIEFALKFFPSLQIFVCFKAHPASSTEVDHKHGLPSISLEKHLKNVHSRILLLDTLTC